MTPTTVNWQPNTLENDLVKLLPLTEHDFDRLFSVAADPLIWEQHPSRNRYQENVFRDFFAGALDSKSAFVIVDKSSGNVIGSTRFYDYKENESIAIGFTFLARQYWGGQYNKAVKELMINYAFNYVEAVIFHIGATNLRSQIATMRFGTVKTGEIITEEQTGQIVSYEYTLRKQDWEKA